VTVGLFTSLSALNPSPFPYAGVSRARNNSGEAKEGVPLGVPVGVVFVLSTLDFLDPDLGVTLLFKNAETGVDISSLGVSARAVLLDAGVVACGAPATLGVKGVLPPVFAEALSVGRRGLFVVCFS